MTQDIYHFGVKGKSGRYPWGSGGRPYQRLEKPKRGGGGIVGYIREAKRKKEEKQAAKTAAEERQAKKNLEEEKQRVIREGNATDVLKFRGQLTNQELQQAYTRINLEAQLKSLSSRELKTSMDKVNDVMKGVKLGTEWIKIGTEAYNSLAEIYNATSEGKKSPLTIVGKGSGKKKDKD